MTFFLLIFFIILTSLIVWIKEDSKLEKYTGDVIREVEGKRNKYEEMQQHKKNIPDFKQTGKLGDLSQTKIELLLDEKRNKIAVLELGKNPEIYDAVQIIHTQVTEQAAPAPLVGSLHKPKQLVSNVSLHIALNNSNKLFIKVTYSFLGPAEYQTDFVQKKVKEFKKIEQRIHKMRNNAHSTLNDELYHKGHFSN